MKKIEIIRIKLDAIKVKIDLAKTKALSFLAIAGGSWIYIFNDHIPWIVRAGAVVIFVFSVYGILLNLMRFSNFDTNIEELENDIK